MTNLRPVVSNWGHGRVLPRRDRKTVSCGHQVGVLCHSCRFDEVTLRKLQDGAATTGVICSTNFDGGVVRNQHMRDMGEL